jgi:hypothetical protein
VFHGHGMCHPPSLLAHGDGAEVIVYRSRLQMFVIEIEKVFLGDILFIHITPFLRALFIYLFDKNDWT